MSSLARSARGLATAVFVLIAAAAAAGDAPTRLQRSMGDDLVYGGAANQAAKTVTDTVLVMGPWDSGAPYNGQFENPSGSPAWNGWTSRDLTQSEVTHWNVNDFGFDPSGTFAPINGTYSVWCGTETFLSCDDGVTDPVGGYGNSWNDMLEFRGTVTDNSLVCNLTVTGSANVYSEPGYDGTTLSVEKSGIGFVQLAYWEGIQPAVVINAVTTYVPGEYMGDAADEVVVVFQFTSDGGWSDEDCSFASAGAFILDNLLITSDNGVSTGGVVGFEDGTLGPLTTRLPLGVGDFANIRRGLDDLDPCAANYTPQVNFIDDGVVVPGTGGSECLSWCYGPGGFVVSNTGGLAGPEKHIDNVIESPPMAWPGAGYEGADLWFDVYRHETLAATMPGVFYYWNVRSTTDTDPAALETAPWQNRNFVRYGGPDYRREFFPVGDLVDPDAQWVQIQLGVTELGWIWGFRGNDGTPAPYFDNVRMTAFPYHGPSMTARVIELPHDAFPEGGNLDLANLGANSVRFDMGMSIANYWDTPDRNDPGDSIVIDVVPVRRDAVLVGMPRLHWSLKRNPLFDPYRTAGLPDLGSVEGAQARNSSGTIVANRFAFDLPDTGFLFPGDFLYYYFSATDEAGGEQQTALMPADTTGFSNFDDPMAYPPIWKLHALPTVTDVAGTQPDILFWDDAGAEGNRDEWYMAFRNLGLIAGVDYDIYYTNAPRSPVGQGLGGRATSLQLAGYEAMLYTSGTTSSATIESSEATGNRTVSPDVQVITGWLEQGGKDMFLTGDDVAGDLYRSGMETSAFLQEWMGVDLVAENVITEIGLQTSPRVSSIASNSVLNLVDGWLAVAECGVASNVYYGGGGSNGVAGRFDGVVPRTGAERLAEFLDPGDNSGQYTFSAATLNYRADYDARVISLPYDFQTVQTDPDEGTKAAASLAARTRLLRDVLANFGKVGSGLPSSVPWAAGFAASNHPNPFNPATTISWNLPRAGHMGVKIYDVRGRVVRNLMDARQDAGPGKVDWDGTDTGGAQVASGVYFYEVRSGDQVQIGKMALIK